MYSICQLYTLSGLLVGGAGSPKDMSDGEYKTTKVYTLLSKLTVMMYTLGKYMYMF